MKITIETCKNGAYVIFDDGENEDKMSYQFDEENLDGLHELLYNIEETVGVMSSRYSEKRIRISIEHGDKYECKGCDLCKENNNA